MPIARAATALLVALSLAACAPEATSPAEITATETLELLALTERIEAELDARDALAARELDPRTPSMYGSLTVAAATRLHR